jgi:hypothetical protein
MIKFSDVIARIKATCPTFGGRVGASVAFQAAISSSSDLAVPHCFVMPVEFKDFSLIEYDESYPETLKVKVVREVFSTVVCLDNSDVRGGKDGGTNALIPLDLLGEIQKEFESGFAGWKPTNLPNTAGDINLVAGEYADSDNKRLWYSFEWAILYRRGNGGLTDEQQAEIDKIIYGDPELTFLVDQVKSRNPASDGTLQPVANPMLELGNIPDESDPDSLEWANAHLDMDQVSPIGETNPTAEDIQEAAAHTPEPETDGDKGVFTSE